MPLDLTPLIMDTYNFTINIDGKLTTVLTKYNFLRNAIEGRIYGDEMEIDATRGEGKNKTNITVTFGEIRKVFEVK